MRILSSLLLSVLLLDCSNPVQQTLSINLDDPQLQGQGKFLLYKNSLFTGKVHEQFESGELRSESHYTNGLLHGAHSTWFEDGKRETMRFYDQGEKEGIHAGWWPNGNQRFFYSFSKGLYDGPFKEWYPDGKRMHEFEYQNGKEVRAMGWRENGKTYINFVVRNGKKYGLTNARLCYSLKDEKGIYSITKN